MPHSAPRHSPRRGKPGDTRPSAARRGYDRAWRRYTKMFLAQPEHVLCADCQHEVATVVDHIIPHKGDYELFWAPSNHQALCKRCHDRKTATQDGGFGRAQA